MRILSVENLSKLYRVGKQGPGSLRDLINSCWGRWAGKTERAVDANHALFSAAQRGPRLNTFWALNNVSFSVGQGEIVGIIGKNGAGKSTLLKILSRVTEPTQGKAVLRGRVSSLLEVGTGFHPDLTGRQNAYLNGAILGMRKKEIDRRFDAIVSFAEIEKFIDTPVKHYSSGMYVRLAFAVAAHLEPEILLVDEVLAVGDAAFQKKCLGKMGEVSKDGRTILFVSHNMVAIQGLCRRVIWLNDGKVEKDASPAEVISSYLKVPCSSKTHQLWEDVSSAPGNEKVRIGCVRIRAQNGEGPEDITIQAPLTIEIEYWNLKSGAHLNLSMGLFNEEGVRVLNTVPIDEPVWHGRAFPAGLFKSVCQIPGNLLNDGIYRLLLLVVQDQGTVIYLHEDILVFEVRDVVDENRGGWYGKWPGAVRPNLVWSTELMEPVEP